ncbi:MAG: hypothetical protein EXS08_03025 [Planctomycetes bacterium]|nr:hypothetical protein [Planctomycetota bacterium]
MRRFSALGALLLGACGWHAGLTVPEGAHSVAVEAARRSGEVLERGLEPELTAALSQAVVDWVELPLAATGQADLVVRAELLEFRRRGGVRNSQNELLETAVFVRARAVLYDRRKGRVLGEPVVAQEWSGYALDDQANESGARARAMRHVADSLVLALFEPGAASRATPASGDGPRP